MQAKRYDITALGELLVDMAPSGTGDRGQLLYEANPGGAPCNLLAMASKLGSRCAFLGRVGQDAFGRMLEREVAALGIDTAGVSFDERIPTTLALVSLDERGERSFSFYRSPGADLMLAPEGVDYEVIDQSALFHFGTLSLTASPSADATHAAVERAMKQGVCISFDPNIRLPLWDDPARLQAAMEYGFSVCHILKVSDEELTYYTGETEPEIALERLRGVYPNIRLYAVTLGAKGCLLCLDGRTITRPGVPQASVVDTTGAGDSFFGVCLHHVARRGLDGLSPSELEQMADRANAAASLVIGRKGALGVMPTSAEIQAVLDRLQ